MKSVCLFIWIPLLLIITLVPAGLAVDDANTLGQDESVGSIELEATTVMNIIGDYVNDTSNSTIPEESKALNFLDSFVKALSVMIVSELGDKTFFLAAILAMRYNKLTVFLGSISSLVLMTVVSALLGWGVTSLIPKLYTFYASVALMFIFGLKMFWDAYRMKPNEAEELQNEAENEINLRERRNTNRDAEDPANQEAGTPLQTFENGVPVEGQPADEVPEPSIKTSPSSTMVSRITTSLTCSKLSRQFSLAPTDESTNPQIRRSEGPKESSRFGKQCLKIFKIFVNSFCLIFLAEWGDRSQLATIVLASVNDVAGIIIGGILGHTICTGLAVLCGALFAKKISVRAVTILGGIVFFGFAVATLIYGPEEDHDINASSF